MAADLSKNLYVYNRAAWATELSRKRFSERALKVTVVKRGIVLPSRKINGELQGGVCDSNFNFVAGYTRDGSGKDKSWITVNSAYTVDSNELVQLDEDVIFGGTLSGHFGHFIVESLSRLWFVITPP